MEKSAPSDPELLTEWLSQQREPAFHALVARYAGLVHATAKRTCGDDSMAAEASQLTFITLAQKAKTLTSCASLGGWLHSTALMQAKNLLRKSQRENRKRQLLQAAMENEPSHASSDVWQGMQPVLDEALAALSDKDREALLLRFYRSFSIREIAETLGIATDAAQKRIDRATERLRAKLTRRGCQAGASLGAAMVSGFAADAQAAMTAVPLLASKAIAASAVGSGVFPFAFISTVAMKTTSAVVPLTILLAAGVWIAGQFQSIATLRQQNAGLRKWLVATRIASVPAGRATPVKTALDKKPVDWEEVAKQLNSGEGAGGYLRSTLRLEEGFLSMNLEELIAALDEIGTASLSKEARDSLENRLGYQLVTTDPENAMKRFIGRIHDGDSSVMRGLLVSAMGLWVEKDQEPALAWFDAEIAVGTFDTKSAGGGEFIRMQFENRLIMPLISRDPETAAKRLTALPPDKRIQVFQTERLRFQEKDHKAFVQVIREQLPEVDRLHAITWPVTKLGENGTVDYPALSKYIDENQLTTAERDACILAVAIDARFMRKNGIFSDAIAEDVDAWRQWVGAWSPGLEDRATAAAISGLLDRMKYPAVAEIALHCKSGGAGDEVLWPLLDDNAHNIRLNKESARAVAGKLSDSKRRAEILKQLGGQP